MVKTPKLGETLPDWCGFIRNIRRKGTPTRVYFLEFGIADEMLEAFDARFHISSIGATETDVAKQCAKRMKIHRYLGHELFRVYPDGGTFPMPARPEGSADSQVCSIASWQDFERYAWPDPEKLDLSILEFYEKNMLPDMKVFTVAHIWERVRELLGYENLCMKLFDDPRLVEAVFKKVAGYIERVVESLCRFDCYGAVFLADDLGFKTSTMISPGDIRRYIIPWHKRLADMAHGQGKLFLLHSCGQVYDLVDDFIVNVGIDAKHSFEDAILPVEEAKRRYGERLTLIGGLDVDVLTRADETTIRRKVREVISVCQPGGGFLFGSGNWVTDYIPFQNYLAAIDEARRCG